MMPQMMPHLRAQIFEKKENFYFVASKWRLNLAYNISQKSYFEAFLKPHKFFKKVPDEAY